MSDKKKKQKSNLETSVKGGKVKYPNLLQEEELDEVVESFSQKFEEDLREILGKKYKEPQKDQK